ncbi:endonuclease domain-containing protein [Haloglycomyces albus]|uniref:endonuclease domain-containing protein n=1 Tax=Haloglycomyces albus TaxID=526067 RepID=UPI001B7FDF5F|nr:endonuclease domain-containing protein [Haloglycomyces albus]
MTNTYGLRPGEYDRLLLAQGGVCAICGGQRHYRLDVDHDHTTGLIRGLCCRNCNRVLLARGMRNRPEIGRHAADYLDNPPALRVLGQRWHADRPKEGR